MEIKEVFEPIVNFVKNFQKKEKDISKQAAKDRLKLVLMQDRASVSPDFFEMMKKEIIDVIKKYIEIDEESLEVQLTRGYEAGLEGPALYANIPIKNIKPVASNGEDISDSSISEVAEMLEDEILNEANKIMEDGNAIVKTEIESIIDENDTSEDNIENETESEEKDIQVEDIEVDVSEVTETPEEKTKQNDNDEKEEENDEPRSADVIAENVAREMKKSVAKSVAATKATAKKRTVKKAGTRKTTAKKKEKIVEES